MTRILALLCLLVAAVPVVAQDDHALFRRGISLENEGDVETAVAIYEDLLGRNPRNTSALYRLAAAYQKLGRLDDAVAVLRGRIRTAPTDITALNRLSDVYLAAGRAADADRTIERILTLSPNQGTFASVGQRFERLNLDGRAVEVYRRGRTVLKDPEAFARELAQIHERGGDDLSAVREYAVVARKRPQYVSLVESRLKAIATRSETPRPLFDELLEGVKAGYRDVRITRVFVTFAIAASLGADALDELLLLPPDAPIEGGLLRLGREALEHGDPGDAIRAFESLAARTRNKSIVGQADAGIARALEQAGRLAEAEGAYTRVIAKPASEDIRDEAAFRLGRMLHRTGRADTAVAVLGRAAEASGRSEWRSRAIHLLADIHHAAGRDDVAADLYARGYNEYRGREEAAVARLRLARLHTIRSEYALAKRHLGAILSGGRASLVFNDAVALSEALDVGLDDDPSGLEAYGKALRAEVSDGALAGARTAVAALEHHRGSLAGTLLRYGVEALFAAERWEEAEQALRRVDLRTGPDAPWAAFALGACLERQRRVDEAVAVYEAVLIDHPDSLEADRARRRLAEIRTGPSPSGEAG